MTDALTCPICFERYDETNLCPRLLPECGHTFCTSCLNNLIRNNRITCPFDNKVIHVSRGIGELPKNFALIEVLTTKTISKYQSNCQVCKDVIHEALYNCVDCNEYMCSKVANIHRSSKATQLHQVLTLEELSTYLSIAEAKMQAARDVKEGSPTDALAQALGKVEIV